MRSFQTLLIPSYYLPGECGGLSVPSFVTSRIAAPMGSSFIFKGAIIVCTGEAVRYVCHRRQIYSLTKTGEKIKILQRPADFDTSITAFPSSDTLPGRPAQGRSQRLSTVLDLVWSQRADHPPRINVSLFSTSFYPHTTLDSPDASRPHCVTFQPLVTASARQPVIPRPICSNIATVHTDASHMHHNGRCSVGYNPILHPNRGIWSSVSPKNRG